VSATKYNDELGYVFMANLTKIDPNCRVLPITTKFIGTCLSLTKYKLDLAHCTALSQTFQHSAFRNLKTLHLQDVGIDDNCFAEIV
jgi:hypothetical protein